jgi:tetraprenyl-beta-curcumene synthase
VTPQTLRTAAAFASAAYRYWLSVFPVARAEIRRLRRRAQQIPNPVLRTLALDAQQRKCASLEGAAAFATFAPCRQRAFLTRLLVELQAVFDYADTLMEQPSSGPPAANARQLHAAFMVALRPEVPHQDYYQYCDHREDGGYLVEIVDSCRDSVRKLASYKLVAPLVTRHAERVLFYQSEINLATAEDYARLECWAAKEQSPDEVLDWWEIGAACGSSLAIFAHIAAARDPALTQSEIDAIETLYWPWTESLHILLDSLIDRAEDHQTRQHNLLDHYTSARLMEDRLELLAREVVNRAKSAPASHQLIVTAMIASYLSDPNAWITPARNASERTLVAAGQVASMALLLLRARRRVL